MARRASADTMDVATSSQSVRGRRPLACETSLTGGDDMSTPEYYSWQPEGKAIVIDLRLDVVDRLNVDIMRGFGATRRRGAEAGGILLGRIERGDPVRVVIEDAVPVPCEYSRGPSYLLSENDLVVFRQTLGGGGGERIGVQRRPRPQRRRPD